MKKISLEALFPFPEQPLYVDFGFAQGEFMFKLAKKRPDVNIIGFEVRKPLAEKAINAIETDNIENLHAFYASSTNHMEIIPDHSIDRVFIFFPDPWFKKRHHKRRILSERFLKNIPSKLKTEHSILFQTDVKELYLDTLEILNANADVSILENNPGILSPNDTGETSYYEQKCLENNWPIYRILLRVYYSKNFKTSSLS